MMYKFLLVDDDPSGLRLLRQYLSPFGQCDLASEGQQALGAFRQALDAGQPYDLVCLDIMMPGLDGHAVLQALRQMESERGILGLEGVKVLMLSATSDPKHCVRAFSEGCEAYISKPLRKARLLAELTTLLGPLQPIASSATKSSRRLRFLLVDDDRTSLYLIASILSFADCDRAENGQQAVALFHQALETRHPYDLVCLDLVMPELDGHAVLQILRRLEREHGILPDAGAKVIAVTAANDADHLVRAFSAGCEGYLPKPFQADDLLQRLANLGVLSLPMQVS